MVSHRGRTEVLQFLRYIKIRSSEFGTYPAPDHSMNQLEPGTLVTLDQ